MNTDLDVLQGLGLTRVDSSPQKSTSDLGQADFLKLMTTQLNNQNPLEPMENGEFLGQIAQFGTVSGIHELKDSFLDFSARISSDQALQASNLVGRSVLVSGNEALLPVGDSLKGELTLPQASSSVEIRIQDLNGEIIRTLNLGGHSAGQVAFAWDGLLDDGTYANPGSYSIQAEGLIGGENTALETQVRANVDSVTLGTGGQGIQLNLAGLGAINFNDISKIL